MKIRGGYLLIIRALIGAGTARGSVDSSISIDQVSKYVQPSGRVRFSRKARITPS